MSYESTRYGIYLRGIIFKKFDVHRISTTIVQLQKYFIMIVSILSRSFHINIYQNIYVQNETNLTSPFELNSSVVI